MSSEYPILHNRRIDQWKVTELKEELKRRKLITRGLKDDLIKRLDEALRAESENAEEANGVYYGPQLVVEEKGTETVSVVNETRKELVYQASNIIEKVNDVTVQVDINESGAAFDKGNIEPGEVQVDINESGAAFDKVNLEPGGILGGSVSARVEEAQVADAPPAETSNAVTDVMALEVDLSERKLQKTELQKENKSSNSLMENEDPMPRLETENLTTQLEIKDPKQQIENPHLMPHIKNADLILELEAKDSKLQLENEVLKSQLENVDLKPLLEYEEFKPQLKNEYSKPHPENEDSKPQLENEDLAPPHEVPMLNASASSNQVSKVNPCLGSQVRSDSISSDTVSFIEKIELKDNISTDYVKLELDITSPSPVGGKSHPMDVEEPHENKAFVGEKDDNMGTIADINKKVDSADVGYSEKLNLDRSSGDDSMEEDVLESKQIDSKYYPDEEGEESRKNEVPITEKEISAGAVGDSLTGNEKDFHFEKKNHLAHPTDKRKLHDQAAAGNEPLKRQRRWTSEHIKVQEPQSSDIIPTTRPKDTFQPTAVKPSVSRSNSAVSEDAPKERIVPPSSRLPTNSLRIDCFVRPFTLEAVQELLGRTGSVTSFWMDHIKTHCYVTYSLVEEAVETRNAVYNLQWPPNGGRRLVAEFVDPQQVIVRAEAPRTQLTHFTAAPTASSAPPTLQPQPTQHQARQELPPPPSVPPPMSLSNASQPREKLSLPPPPPLPDITRGPIITLDDLFQKTKATPRIYYLPLSEERVTAQIAARGKNAKI